MEHQSPAVTIRQVSVSEASRELNISPETVRRRIKAGRLQAERAIRPQGAVWLVTLPVTSPCGVPSVAPVTTPQCGADQEPTHAPSAEACDPSPPVASVTHVSPVTAAPSPPPTPELADLAATVREQAETIVRLTRMLEQLTADMDALRVAQAGWEPILMDEPGAPAPAPDPFPAPTVAMAGDAAPEDRWQTRAAVATGVLLVLVAASLAPTLVR